MKLADLPPEELQLVRDALDRAVVQAWQEAYDKWDEEQMWGTSAPVEWPVTPEPSITRDMEERFGRDR